jgi:hypothetical protein
MSLLPRITSSAARLLSPQTTSRRWPLAARLVSLSALSAVTAAAALGCAGEQPQPTGLPSVQEAADAARVISRTDPRTGLRFEIESNTLFGDSGLRIAFSPATPASLREQLRGADFMPGCDVPGVSVRGFPQRWGDLDDEVGTALVADPAVSIADRATRCWLEIGEPGPRPGTVLLTGEVVAEVEVRR